LGDPTKQSTLQAKTCKVLCFVGGPSAARYSLGPAHHENMVLGRPDLRCALIRTCYYPYPKKSE